MPLLRDYRWKRTRAAFGSLQAHGSTLPLREEMFDFDQLNGVIGTPELMALGKRFEG